MSDLMSASASTSDSAFACTPGPNPNPVFTFNPNPTFSDFDFISIKSDNKIRRTAQLRRLLHLPTDPGSTFIDIYSGGVNAQIVVLDDVYQIYAAFSDGRDSLTEELVQVDKVVEFVNRL